jgi:hypothetical protein
MSTREVCVACKRAILDPAPNVWKLPCGGAIPPFYLFPTGQAFHVLCAAAEVVQYGGETRAARVKKLLQKLSRLDPGVGPHTTAAAERAGGWGGTAGEERVEVLANRLVEEVGCEDPWNGELLVRMIDMPFIRPDVDAEVATWKV